MGNDREFEPSLMQRQARDWLRIMINMEPDLTEHLGPRSEDYPNLGAALGHLRAFYVNMRVYEANKNGPPPPLPTAEMVGSMHLICSGMFFRQSSINQQDRMEFYDPYLAIVYLPPIIQRLIDNQYDYDKVKDLIRTHVEYVAGGTGLSVNAGGYRSILMNAATAALDQIRIVDPEARMRFSSMETPNYTPFMP